MIITTQTMQTLLPKFKKEIATLKSGEIFTFEVPNPDLSDGYAGGQIQIEGEKYLIRGYKAWSDLAEILFCKMLTPEAVRYPFVKLRFQKLKTDNSFHTLENEDKYGSDSPFAQIHKMEEPAFLYYYQEALINARVETRKAILDLGINSGDEFEVIQTMLPAEIYEKLALVGIDYSPSAIALAQKRFPHPNVTFYTHDMNDLAKLPLAKYDLLISIGTLQSSTIDFKPFFMSLVQNYLTEDSAIILGFPNARWIDGEMIYGAKAPNYRMNEMSLVLNDIMFAKKYLQQHRYRVTVTGKAYLFLTATKITKD